MSIALGRKVAVVGVGCSRFGELYDRDAEDLLCDAVDDTLAAAIKLYGRPITRVQNYCASGMDAFRSACAAVAAGLYDVVIAAGFEKMRDGELGAGTRGTRSYAGAARLQSRRRRWVALVTPVERASCKDAAQAGETARAARPCRLRAQQQRVRLPKPLGNRPRGAARGAHHRALGRR